MNNETTENILIVFLAATIIGIGFLIGYNAIPHSSDDIIHVQKEVYDVATTTVSISQEEVDCKKQGGEFDIIPQSTINPSPDTLYFRESTAGVDAYNLTCTLHTPDKVLSSQTISVGN